MAVDGVTPDRMTSHQVLQRVWRHYADKWAVLTEVETRQPPAPGQPSWASTTRRCDVLLVSSTRRVVLEVKVSRSDFLGDVADPTKQAAWAALAHQHAYLVPEGLCTADEVPVTSGLLIVPNGQPLFPQVKWARKAPIRRNPDPLPAHVSLALLYRLGRAEALAKGYAAHAVDNPDELRAKVHHLERELTKAHDATTRARERAGELQRVVSRMDPQPCDVCEQPLRWSSGRRRYGGDWVHVAPGGDEACAALRDRLQQEASDRGERLYLFVTPREPEP